MNKFYLIILIFTFISSCSLNKVIKHHGVLSLDKKQKQLKIDKTNKNDLVKLLGPPSTIGTFDEDIWIYIERTTSSTRVLSLGKKKLLTNNVLIVKINNKGLLDSKLFLNKEKMQKLEFSKDFTKMNRSEKSFIYEFLRSLRLKINDPLGKKRIKKTN